MKSRRIVTASWPEELNPIRTEKKLYRGCKAGSDVYGGSGLENEPRLAINAPI